MADPAFYRAIARLAEVANTDDASCLTPQEVTTVLVTTLRDAASDLDRVQEDRQRGTLLTPGEIGAYIGVEVPAGVVIADWLREQVQAGVASHMEPVKIGPRPLRYEEISVHLEHKAGRGLNGMTVQPLVAILVPADDLATWTRQGKALRVPS
jgi:hypothetical protein